MISKPARMVAQQRMERIFSFFYRASATAPRANHSDFFQHRRLIATA
jgi:hypothetical protein